MKPIPSTFALLAIVVAGLTTTYAQDPLPSWNDGPAKQAIVDFVKATTETGSKDFVPPEERIATFDQDGTLWVEHPMYSQVMYSLHRVGALVKEKPELKDVEPFKTVISGDREAIGKLTMPDLEKILAATLTGMPTEQFQAEVKRWFAEAKDPRWHKPYNELTYQPMQEVLTYLRANGYKTYICTGGGQQMLEYTKAGSGARLAMLVLHDDAKREYAYGPARGLPDTKVGTFTQTLYDEAKKQGWTVISMKDDWKKIFAFEE